VPEAARLKSVSNVWKSLARDFAIAFKHLFFSFKFLQHHFGVYLYISMPLTLVMFLAILVGGLEHEFYDFPFSWECHHPNLSLHHFSEG